MREVLPVRGAIASRLRLPAVIRGEIPPDQWRRRRRWRRWVNAGSTAIALAGGLLIFVDERWGAGTAIGGLLLRPLSQVVFDATEGEDPVHGPGPDGSWPDRDRGPG